MSNNPCLTSNFKETVNIKEYKGYILSKDELSACLQWQMVIFVQSWDLERKIDEKKEGFKLDNADERWRWGQSYFYYLTLLTALYLTAAKSLCLD